MKFTALLTGEMSGSMAGITASRGRGGNYFRARSVPVNPNTSRQVTVRGVFANLVNVWKGLTDAARQEWTNYATATPRTDRLGNPLVLTGQQAFIAANVASGQALAEFPASGFGFITTAPTQNDRGTPVTDITIAAVSATSLTATVTLPGGASADAGVTLSVGAPVNASVGYARKTHRLAAIIDQGAIGADDTFADLVLNAAGDTFAGPYGTIEAGMRIPVKATIVYVDGRVPVSFERIVTVTAA